MDDYSRLFIYELCFSFQTGCFYLPLTVALMVGGLDDL